jgi:Holliday junction resolvasome RuvABC DNA-binding subunit
LREEALSALVNLGYRRAEAERVLAEVGTEIPLEEAIREALRRFAR